MFISAKTATRRHLVAALLAVVPDRTEAEVVAAAERMIGSGLADARIVGAARAVAKGGDTVRRDIAAIAGASEAASLVAAVSEPVPPPVPDATPQQVADAFRAAHPHLMPGNDEAISSDDAGR